MKKYLLLLSLSIATITTNSSAMFKNLQNKLKTITLKKKSPANQIKVKPKTENSLEAALELNYLIKNLQSIVPKKDPYFQYGDSPWSYYRIPSQEKQSSTSSWLHWHSYQESCNIEQSSVTSWVYMVSARYDIMNNQANSIEKVINELPCWSDKNHKKEHNSLIKKWISHNLQLLTEYHTFLLEHSNKLELLKKSHNNHNLKDLELFKNPIYHGIMNNMEQELQNNLKEKSQSFKETLAHYNSLILRDLHVIDCNLENKFYHYQKDQRNRE